MGLERLLDLCDRLHIKGTIFFAGRFAEAYPALVRECLVRGHILGTHGWAHGGLERDEDFRRASYGQQQEWNRLATDAVERAASIRPIIFRVPNLWISETTFGALEAEGYRYDSSIPARRFDMGFGRVHYVAYFCAPLEPYQPAHHNLAMFDECSIIEIAPSSCLFPINLALLRTLRLPTLLRMIRWIGRRSRHLVFYRHPFEFVRARHQQFPRSMSKRNKWGMCPENLILLEQLLEHVIRDGFLPARMTEMDDHYLDLKQAVVL